MWGSNAAERLLVVTPDLRFPIKISIKTSIHPFALGMYSYTRAREQIYPFNALRARSHIGRLAIGSDSKHVTRVCDSTREGFPYDVCSGRNWIRVCRASISNVYTRACSLTYRVNWSLYVRMCYMYSVSRACRDLILFQYASLAFSSFTYD